MRQADIITRYDVGAPFFAMIDRYIADGTGDGSGKGGARHKLMRWMSALTILPAVLAGALGADVSHALSPAGSPAALAGLEPGLWDLRSRDPGEPPLRICVRDPQSLLQLRHQGQACRRFLVEDSADRASVSYSCPGTGHGLTVVRVETPRLVQIDSQGVADGAPFALDLEGRRIGACAPVTARK